MGCGGVCCGSWCSVLVAVVLCAVGCCGLVDNRIGDEGCAALARALEGGAVPELSTLILSCMYFGVSEFDGASGV